MDAVSSSFQHVRKFAEGSTWGSVITLLGLAAAVLAFVFQVQGAGEPPSLLDPIPFVFNTTQLLIANEKFMLRVSKILDSRNLAKFFLGFTPVYLVSGPKHIQTIFGRSHNFSNEKIFLEKVFPVLYWMPKKDVDRFTSDKSGRNKVPAPGTEDTPPENRVWAQYADVHTEYLSRTQHMKPIIEYFRGQLTSKLEKFPKGKWTEVGIIDLCRHDVTECAISALFGPKVFELNEGFLDAFWQYDENIFTLVLGLPEWVNPRPYRVRDRFLTMIDSYLRVAWKEFDWNGPDADAYFEPHFGARVSREIVRWLKDGGFHDRSQAGALGSLLFAQNSNSIPTTMWVIMEVLADPELLQAVREEINALAFVTDPDTSERVIDAQKIATLPLLQSVFNEVLRMHMNFNIMRNLTDSVTMDGYTLRKGATIQAPMLVAHYDEAVWAKEGRPASQFWADRHIKYKDQTDEFGKVSRERTFAMAGRPSSYFPFGKILACPLQFICS
ncbi:Cholesterol 7-alpha-monooxygenase 4 [Seiridium cupressi]